MGTHMPQLNNEILGQNTAHTHPLPHILSPKPYTNLYHPQELAVEGTMSHPWLRLWGREVKGFIIPSEKLLSGWAKALGLVSSCPSQPGRVWAVGQGDVTQWKEPGKSSLIRVTLITTSPLNPEPSGNIELTKVKGHCDSRILCHLIAAVSVESRCYLFSNFLAFICYSNLPIAADGFTCVSLRDGENQNNIKHQFQIHLEFCPHCLGTSGKPLWVSNFPWNKCPNLPHS